jgi:hypothetical protein
LLAGRHGRDNRESRPHADDRPLLFETRCTAGLKCTQCDPEQPPKLAKIFD